MRSLLLWASIVSVCAAIGFATGSGLDAIFWRVSRDYVYLPGEFRYSGTVIGLLCGSVAAAAALIGRRPVPGARQSALAVAAGSLVLLASLLVGGVAGGIAGKRQSAGASDGHLAPIARVMACEGLRWGGLVGAVIGTLTTALLYSRFRGGDAASVERLA